MWGNAQVLNLPEVTSVCNESSVVLDAGAGFESYDWNGEFDTQTITVYASGTYSVTVTNESGVQTDETNVIFVDYEVFPGDDIQVCPGEELILHVVPEIYTVTWMPDNVINDTLIIYPESDEEYQVEITDGEAICYQDISLTTYPEIEVQLEQINELCFGDCDGQMIASVSGGAEPYSFLWNGRTMPWDSIAVDLCPGENELEVSDQNGCIYTEEFTVEALPAAEVEITSLPSDTIYLENPTLTFSFENLSDSEVTEWQWEFGDGDTSLLQEVMHTYAFVKEYDIDSYVLYFTAINEYGCDTVIAKELTVQEAELNVPNVMTPNSDGINDVFLIQNENNGNDISYEYISVELIVHNRYGKVVYSNSNYQNDWKAKGLSDGTYYWVIRTHGYFRDDDYQGVLTILGSQK